jgi:hypothetical protein
MLTIKLMSNESHLDDTNPNKGFRLMQVPERSVIRFAKEDFAVGSGDFNEAYPYTLSIESEKDGVVLYALTGNVYVISESGKTIATYRC